MTAFKIYIGRIAAICLPAALVFLCFRPYRMKALGAMKLKSTLQREIALVLFVVSIFGVLSLTLWPTVIWWKQGGVWGSLVILIERPTWTTGVNLVPFSVFRDYLDDLYSGPSLFISAIINLFGNLALFVPIGLFPALLFRQATWKRSLLLGFLMSCFIEFAQYFIMRNVAVDDVILNTAGAACGYFLFLGMRRFWPHFTDGFLCQIVFDSCDCVHAIEQKID